jgi:hypothetical protein
VLACWRAGVFVAVLASTVVSSGARAQCEFGDITGDGNVDVHDLAAFDGCLLGWPVFIDPISDPCARGDLAPLPDGGLAASGDHVIMLSDILAFQQVAALFASTAPTIPQPPACSIPGTWHIGWEFTTPNHAEPIEDLVFRMDNRQGVLCIPAAHTTVPTAIAQWGGFACEFASGLQGGPALPDQDATDPCTRIIGGEIETVFRDFYWVQTGTVQTRGFVHTPRCAATGLGALRRVEYA